MENDLPRMLSVLRCKLAYGDKKWLVKPHKPAEARGFKLWAKAVSSRTGYNLLVKTARRFQKFWTGSNGLIAKLPSTGGQWTQDRDMRPIAGETFHERWQKREKRDRQEGKS